MMLGVSIDDPDGIEGGRSTRCEGLDLLDHRTVMGPVKRTEITDVTAFGRTYRGYEIRYGDMTAEPFVTDGNVMATTVHGLFEHPDFIEQLLGVSVEPTLEATFDLLADTIDAHLDTDWLRSRLA